MKAIRNHRPSAALVVACLALFVALGGVGYAAATIHGKNIKNGTIAPKKLKRNSLGGAQIKESKLGEVPSAASARTAGSAQTAQTAQSAQSAQSAADADQLDGIDSGGFLQAKQRAYLDRLPALNDFADQATLASLDLPAGQYTVVAKLNYDNDGAAAEESCELVLPATGNDDEAEFSVGADGTGDETAVSMASAVVAPTAGTALVRCSGDGDDNVRDVALVATRLD
jgi:hypothetical protein